MVILRNLIVAFSLYSRIPVPIFQWQERDLKYSMVFLPWVGAVIGALSFGVGLGLQKLCIPVVPQVLLLSAIPILLTGGFHIDGFMDVQDALNSYKPREEKLKILKDPHIGAFAVISLLALALLWGAGLYLVLESGSRKALLLAALLYPLVRAPAGLSSLCFPHAKKDGMLHTETNSAGRGSRIALAVETFALAAAAVAISVPVGLLVLAGLGVFTFVYYRRCMKQLGGVTGDTAGWYVVTGELVCLCLVAAGGLLWL